MMDRGPLARMLVSGRRSQDGRRREGEIREHVRPGYLMDDKDQAAAPVGIRPIIEPFGREHRVLRRLHQAG